MSGKINKTGFSICGHKNIFHRLLIFGSGGIVIACSGGEGMCCHGDGTTTLGGGVADAYTGSDATSDENINCANQFNGIGVNAMLDYTQICIGSVFTDFIMKLPTFRSNETNSG